MIKINVLLNNKKPAFLCRNTLKAFLKLLRNHHAMYDGVLSINVSVHSIESEVFQLKSCIESLCHPTELYDRFGISWVGLPEVGELTIRSMVRLVLFIAFSLSK